MMQDFLIFSFVLHFKFEVDFFCLGEFFENIDAYTTYLAREAQGLVADASIPCI